jgi:hypothetical protein
MKNKSAEDGRRGIELNASCRFADVIAGAVIIAFLVSVPIFLIPPLFYGTFAIIIPDPHVAAKAQSMLWDGLKFLIGALIAGGVLLIFMLICKAKRELSSENGAKA